MTLRVNHFNWKQTVDDLRTVALTDAHPRTRERFLALYEITQGTSASQVAAQSGRYLQTVHGWVHRYNLEGPEAVAYRKTGGRPPFVPRSKSPLMPRSARRSRRPQHLR